MGSWEGTVPDIPVRSVRSPDLQILADIASAITDAWSTYTPAWGATSAPSIGSGQLLGAYRRAGKFGECAIRVVGAADTTWGTGSYSLQLPTGWDLQVGAHVNLYGYGVVFDSSATTYYACTLGVVGGDTTKIRIRPHANGNLNATNLVTLATADEILAHVVTELQ